MGERLVPDAAGWWWRRYAGGPEPVEVTTRSLTHADAGLLWRWGDNDWQPIEDDGLWLGPCQTPDELRALTAERDALAAKVARVEACVRDFEDELRGVNMLDLFTEALEAEDE